MRTRYSIQVRLQFVELLESGTSRRAAVTALGVRDETSWQWERAYRRGGLEALITIANRGPYSSDIDVAVSAKTVRRLMREEGCVCRSRRRRPGKMYRGALNQISPNILERNFTATEPNQKWVTDVTQFYINSQLVYLSPLIDLFNGEVLS